MKAIKGSPIEEEELKRFSQPGKYLDPKKIVKLPVVMLQKSRSVVEEAPASTWIQKKSSNRRGFMLQRSRSVVYMKLCKYLGPKKGKFFKF